MGAEVNARARSLMIRYLAVALALASSLGLAGCAGMGVKPYERELLAERAMLVDPDPVDSAYNDHIYFSIEGSSGGRSFGGGGCGCN
jgi:hypothetical protein